MLKLVAPLLALITVGVLPAVSQDKPVLPVIAIQQVDAENSELYGMLIARNNATVKEKLGLEDYFRVYIGVSAGSHTGAVFVVTAADSYATLSKNGAAIFGDPDMVARRGQLAAVRELGPNSSYKALRFGGAYKGAHIYNAWMKVSDEAGYNKALGELRALLDGHGLSDCHLNFYRGITGREDASHFVSFNTPSSERLAAFLDVMSTDEGIRDWIAKSAQYRTITRTGTYREISQ